MTPTSQQAPAETTARLPQLLFVGLVFLAWYVIGEAKVVSRILLPPLPDVLSAIPTLLSSAEFGTDLSTTLFEVFCAFAIAAFLGILIGFVVGRSPFMTREFEPLIAASYAVPLILFFPLFILLFGAGPSSKIAIASLVAFFPITLNAIAGFSTVNPTIVAAARLMGATSSQLTWSVMIPAALPVVATGLRMGLVLSMLAAVGSETIVATGGLGYRMVVYSETMDTPEMYAVILVIIAIASILTGLSSWLERSLQRHLGVEE